MIAHEAFSTTALGAVATCCLLMMSGCAGVRTAKLPEPVPPAAPVEQVVDMGRPEAEPTKAAPTEPAPAAVKVPATAKAPAAAKSVTVAKPPSTAKVQVPPAVPPAVPTAPSKPAPIAQPHSAAPTPPASLPARAPLDLGSLGTRLKQTKAIGVLTKLSLKNQVDGLLAKFRAYHARQGGPTLAELRRSYDMLILKVLALLQDSDPPLARDIVKSRAAIWGILADPEKFNDASLMAGATT